MKDNKYSFKNIKKIIKELKLGDLFYISNGKFSAAWNGKIFDWKAPSGQIYEMDKRDVVKHLKHAEKFINEENIQLTYDIIDLK